MNKRVIKRILLFCLIELTILYRFTISSEAKVSSWGPFDLESVKYIATINEEDAKVLTRGEYIPQIAVISDDATVSFNWSSSGWEKDNVKEDFAEITIQTFYKDKSKIVEDVFDTVVFPINSDSKISLKNFLYNASFEDVKVADCIKNSIFSIKAFYEEESAEIFFVFEDQVEDNILSFEKYSEGTNPIIHGTIYRLLNEKTGEHLYTISSSEKDMLKNMGWKEEENLGISYGDEVKIFRLFNTVTGEHLYTSNTGECDILTKDNIWKYDNSGKPAFYGMNEGETPVYRLFNPKANAIASHHYTSNKKEIEILIKVGWVYDNDSKPIFFL